MALHFDVFEPGDPPYHPITPSPLLEHDILAQQILDALAEQSIEHIFLQTYGGKITAWEKKWTDDSHVIPGLHKMGETSCEGQLREFRRQLNGHKPHYCAQDPDGR